ncbi:YsnF/AvaK domain-containing protein [Kitasatospora sp. NPDC056531]|uniref:YsnF/AvaK domain-containing protein n=1 Tax=Kitasatospora sp. NPDC056531 TaxID=3345856 RepID=UPI00367B591C
MRTLTTPAPTATTATTPLVEPKPKPQPAPAPTTPAPTGSAATTTPSTPAPTTPAPTATTPLVEPKPKPQPAPAPTTPAPTGGAATTTPSTPAATTPAPTGGGAATTAPSAPVEITCREERLDITTEWHVLGTAKLRKYVTSEQVERRVPLVRERVRVERIPVSDAERSVLTDKEIAEAVEEVTLREEHPIVRKYLAPIERVRLIVERYTTEEVVQDELRREHVEVHDNTTATPDPTAPVTNGVRPDPLRPLS